MQAGDRIRIQTQWGPLKDFTVEEFRYCLGVFETDEHRNAGSFTPLCDLYERGPDSENKYSSLAGDYITNMVPSFMNLPKD